VPEHRRKVVHGGTRRRRAAISRYRRGPHQRRFETSMAKTNPVEFFQQVRAEARKVTWPTRRETLITTAMVFVMVVLASLFFLVADQILSFVVAQILQIGR
jgi:preprotein translocase subunit SecE